MARTTGECELPDDFFEQQERAQQEREAEEARREASGEYDAPRVRSGSALNRLMDAYYEQQRDQQHDASHDSPDV